MLFDLASYTPLLASPLQKWVALINVLPATIQAIRSVFFSLGEGVIILVSKTFLIGWKIILNSRVSSFVSLLLGELFECFLSFFFAVFVLFCSCPLCSDLLGQQSWQCEFSERSQH